MSADRAFVPPIRADLTDDGRRVFRINLDEDERALVVRLLGELRELLRSDGESEEARALLHRLFPPAYTDDEEKEAEYQRLMREELVTSRIAQIETVADILTDDDCVEIGEDRTIALMQSINAIRVVLGTMLDIGEDDEPDEESTPEHHLYAFLSWLLEWTVRSLSATPDDL